MLAHEQSLIRKIFSVVGCMIVFVVLITVRLYHLQINLTNDLLNRSNRNFLRYEKTNSLRGTIIDTKGKLLATNKPIVNIYWKGSGNKTLSKNQEALLQSINQHFEITTPSTEVKQAERAARKVLLAEDIPFEQLSKIAEQFGSEEAISIETDYKRFYPHKNLASHALGYLGNLDMGWSGKMGLEKLYESVLKGKHGLTQKVLNSFGKHLSEQEVEQALAGQDIAITLDLSLQRIAEMLFPKDRKGIFLLMDSHDGSLRVALSRPDFDPNLFLGNLNQETWNNLKERKPFLNRIYNACYPPGSIFKLVTLAAAIEHNIILEDELFKCKGFVKIGNRKFRCNKQQG